MSRGVSGLFFGYIRTTRSYARCRTGWVGRTVTHNIKNYEGTALGAIELVKTRQMPAIWKQMRAFADTNDVAW